MAQLFFYMGLKVNKFELSSAFIIGHEEIDAEHAELVDILNDMVDCFIERNVDYCKSKWQDFCEKLEQHFAHEIKIMDGLGFEDAQHEKGHEEILRHIQEIGANCQSLEDWEDCLFTMRNDLLTWVLKHDLKFAEYLFTIGYSKF